MTLNLKRVLLGDIKVLVKLHSHFHFFFLLEEDEKLRLILTALTLL